MTQATQPIINGNEICNNTMAPNIGHSPMCATVHELKTWINTTKFDDFSKEIEAQVIGQPELRRLLANVYCYITNLALNSPIQCNTILAAPSGAGKTETYRALKAYFKEHIPSLHVSIADASQITATGYKGMDATELAKLNWIKGTNVAMGLCFLDEIDKKMAPSYAEGHSNVNQEVQDNLLTIIEGGNVITKDGLMIDTSRVMYIGLGSFEHYRKKRENKPRAIGFGAEDVATDVDHYKPITRADMAQHGGTNELLGRFTYIINYQKLSKEAINKVIDKIGQSVARTFNCTINCTGDYIQFLHQQAGSKYGCRGLDSIVKEHVLDQYTLALSAEPSDVLEITLVNEETGTYIWRQKTLDEYYSEIDECVRLHPECFDGKDLRDDC